MHRGVIMLEQGLSVLVPVKGTWKATHKDGMLWGNKSLHKNHIRSGLHKPNSHLRVNLLDPVQIGEVP